MKRSLAFILLAASAYFWPARVRADVTIGPGVQPPINVYSTDHYHLVTGTQITGPSLSGSSPASLLVDETMEFQGGGSLRIDGGQYQGGNATYNGPLGTFTTVNAGHALRLMNFAADIYGGNFQGGNAFSTSDNGSAAGGVGLIASLSSVNIYGGSFNAGTLTQPNVPFYPSNYPKVADVAFFSSNVNLHGGDIGYIILGNGSTLHVYGKNLQQVAHYAVYGNFADGSPINLLIYNEGQVILHDLVPEPSAVLLSLLATALILWRPCSCSSRVC
jgi:hypothetical protein